MIEGIERLAPMEIERRSFEIINQELAEQGICLPEDQREITIRAIHASADFDYARNMYYSPGAVAIARDLLRQGTSIVTDTNMARAGISKKSLEALGGRLCCFMADADVAARAAALGTTRAAVSMDKAARLPGPVFFAVGNAPTALVRLRELMDEGTFAPAFIVAAPVGFVNVVRSKELIMESGVPCIVCRGRKGGSTVAAAIVNALLYGIKRV